MSFPVAEEVLVIDSGGTSPPFRQQLAAKCRAHAYVLCPVLFRPSPPWDASVAPASRSPSDVFWQQMHSELARERSLYGATYIVQDDRAAPVRLEFPQLPLYRSCQLDPKERYAVIGDVHECVAELQALMQLLEAAGATRYVLVGDVLDRGGATLETLRFLVPLIESGRVILVRGNHELVLSQLLAAADQKRAALQEDDPCTLQLPSSVPMDAKQEQRERDRRASHSALAVLETSAEARRLFATICQRSVPFAALRSRDGLAFVSHAPCPDAHLGKLHHSSLLRQCKYVWRRAGEHQDQDDGVDEDPADPFANGGSLSFLPQQVAHRGVYRIYGHVAFAGAPYRCRNSIGVDTGCVYGGRLSAVMLRGSPLAPCYFSVPAMPSRADRSAFLLHVDPSPSPSTSSPLAAGLLIPPTTPSETPRATPMLLASSPTFQTAAQTKRNDIPPPSDRVDAEKRQQTNDGTAATGAVLVQEVRCPTPTRGSYADVVRARGLSPTPSPDPNAKSTVAAAAVGPEAVRACSPQATANSTTGTSSERGHRRRDRC